MRVPSASLRPFAVHPGAAQPVWTPVPRELKAQLQRQVEELRALMPYAGAARPALQAELERLERFQQQLARTGNLVELPAGTDVRSITRPSPALQGQLGKVRDAALEGLRKTLGDRNNWVGGVLPELVAKALASAGGPRAMAALLERADVRAAMRSMTDFGYDPVSDFDGLRRALNTVNGLFGLSV